MNVASDAGTEGMLSEAVRRRIRDGMSNAQIMAEVPVSIRTIAAYRAVETRRQQNAEDVTAQMPSASDVETENPGEVATFKFERDLEANLSRHLDQLEAGLKLLAVQHALSGAGILDILAEDIGGALVAIELKAVDAGRDAVGQVCGYMGALMATDPGRRVRGILVAPTFKTDARFAARAVPEILLRTYGFQFTFRDPDAPEA